ncbi:acyl-CoA reductase [Algoriphagus hitonicola]|uniref:Acyl-CoA reductase (LuxC) n=1 Tax=Algoriphagus hitonicola TaxID=435880 RepID=A0A1I2TXK4_9BACT|nr:acyl-CoA reductase [Algoriphagus hitonicola]SFG67306.1 Acyl-CoA reductase (LuxC) [Algoriphagus hitonicola]
MTVETRIQAFIQLGELIRNLTAKQKELLFSQAENRNNWFTQTNCEDAMEGIAFLLKEEKLRTWLAAYPLVENIAPKKVGVLMAGNIPLVGFHDLMTVLISGHYAHVKLSSSDEVLMKWVITRLIEIQPEFDKRIEISEMLKAKDAYIATGSDNSARYFSYYFGKYPAIIRQNRTSVGIFDGSESEDELRNFGKDVFQYFGLGCRNVSKIFVKDEDQLIRLLDSLEVYQDMANHHKYHNNYDYNKSIYLVNGEPHLDNGFLILKQSSELVSPISVLYYSFYENLDSLKNQLDTHQDKIQCIVANPQVWSGAVPFGAAQRPEVWDYADGVDTMAFLAGLK